MSNSFKHGMSGKTPLVTKQTTQMILSIGAVANNRLYTKPEDVRKIHRRRLSSALRQVHRVNDEGTTYRAKQCVTLIEEGKQRTLVFDIDKNGTPRLRQKAAKQRRDAIANDVYRARSDVDHMNYAFPKDEPIQFEMDFTEDFEERGKLWSDTSKSRRTQVNPSFSSALAPQCLRSPTALRVSEL